MYTNCFRDEDPWWQRFEVSILQLLVYFVCHHDMDSYHIDDICLQHDLIQASTFSQSFSILISAIQNCKVKTKSNPNAFCIDHNWIDMLGPLAILCTLWIHLSSHLWRRKWWSFSWCNSITYFLINCITTLINLTLFSGGKNIYHLFWLSTNTGSSLSTVR